MLAYPQLSSGAISQFPVKRRRQQRTIVNDLGNGWTVKQNDPYGAITEWTLPYSGLTGAEVTVLEGFFAEAEGTLNGFTFLDPVSNLLAHSSGDPTKTPWQHGPLLSAEGAIADPAGGTAGWHLTNSGAGTQSITQTIAAPGGYLYCFSVYARAAQPAAVTLLIDGNRTERTIGEWWTRIAASSHGNDQADSVTFGLEVAAGAEIDVYGFQAEPQAAPSAYQASGDGGVYEDARLLDDALTVTATDVNCYSCTVNIIHVNHQ